MLLEKLEQRPEAADVTLTDECFDVCYYLDCCKNLAPEQPAPSLSAERKEEIISGILKMCIRDRVKRAERKAINPLTKEAIALILSLIHISTGTSAVG